MGARVARLTVENGDFRPGQLTSSDGGPSPAAYAWPAFQEDYKRCMWASMWVTCMGISNIGIIAREAEKAKGTDAPWDSGAQKLFLAPQKIIYTNSLYKRSL